MNANPASAVSVGASPNDEMRQGTPALQSTVVRAPEPPRAAVTTLETFEREAWPRATSIAFRSTLAAPAPRSLLHLARIFGISCSELRRPSF